MNDGVAMLCWISFYYSNSNSSLSFPNLLSLVSRSQHRWQQHIIGDFAFSHGSSDPAALLLLLYYGNLENMYGHVSRIVATSNIVENTILVNSRFAGEGGGGGGVSKFRYITHHWNCGDYFAELFVFVGHWETT